MSTLADDDLAAFVAAAAVMLDLQLDEEALTPVTGAMRGVMVQAALVLNHSKPAPAE
jgi:hypothetical protein